MFLGEWGCISLKGFSGGLECCGDLQVQEQGQRPRPG